MERYHVGIRDLGRNLSLYVRRALGGDTFGVNDRGSPEALFGPLPPESSSALGRLVREGKVKPPAGDVLDLGLPGGRESTEMSEALRTERDLLPGP